MVIRRSPGLLLTIWIVIGTLLRFYALGFLPPWTDECATAVFSLGHSFLEIPLNEIISLETLLEPLKTQPETQVGIAIERLFNESTHPPLYFALTHFWLGLWQRVFPDPAGYVSLWGLRFLAAFFGVCSIPALFALSWVSFRSPTIAQFSAAIAALSPFGVFLARQARHYTLVILILIVSLSFLVRAIQAIQQQRSLPPGFGVLWTLFNALGMATHYFFSLSLGLQAIVLLGFLTNKFLTNKFLTNKFLTNKIYLNSPILAGNKARNKDSFPTTAPPVTALLQTPSTSAANPISKQTWKQIYIATFGTFAACLIWLPLVSQLYGTPLTHWVQDGDPRTEWLEPLLRLLLWLLSMVFVLPSAFSIFPLPVLILSGLVSLGILIIFLPGLISGWKQVLALPAQAPGEELARENCPERSPDFRLGTQIFGVYFVVAIVLFLGLTYIPEIDLTLAHRFQFVYFPALLILVGVSLATVWHQEDPERKELGQLNLKRVDWRRLDWRRLDWRQLVNFRLKFLGSKLRSGQAFALQILSLALLGSLLVVGNLTYLQNHRPDLLFPLIKTQSQTPILIVTGYQHHGDTGRMMGLAWQFRTGDDRHQPQFFLTNWQGYNESIATLRATVTEMPRPLAVWFVDMLGNIDLELESCPPDPNYRGEIGQHRYRLYRCEE